MSFYRPFRSLIPGRWSLAFLTWMTLLLSSYGQQLAQTVELQPGWNAIWVEADPADRTPSAVFAGLPVHSVWTYSERISATDFIQNPESTGWNRAQWLAYFPTNSPEARLANLFAILPQRAYLVRLAGTNEVSWTIQGRPTLRTPPWVADRFNLRGFPVDPSAPPTFQQFFRSSPAHYDPKTARMQTMFRLTADGQWTEVTGGDRMRRGEAYWVYTQGPSDFIAPFSLTVDSGETINFNQSNRRVEVSLKNRHALAKTIRIAPLAGANSPLLLLPLVPSGGTNESRPLTEHDQPVSAGTSVRLRLGLDRSQLPNSPGTDPTTGRHGTLLSLSDGEGTSYVIGVEAQSGDAEDYTGLWMGTVTITNVSSVVSATNGPTTPGPVAAGFPLRLLLHVDTGGQVSLLRDVTLIYTQTNSATTTNGTAVLGVRQLTQLVTDPAWLVRYTAADIQNGLVSGRRITAPHFDFARTNGQFTQPLQGVFGAGNTVTGTLNISPDLPTNPFLHRYHPDHSTNAYAITRALSLALGSSTSSGNGSSDEVVAGVFQETITGLHKQPLFTSGSMELHRISTLGQLNLVNP